MRSEHEHRPWWATAVFYQIYPRSYADGNGDGIGDLIGARERLGHLERLGIDALWLSPFYRSPMADGGYDVADPCDVDPMFGTLADFDALLADAHARGIRVTVDIVPNHVSAQHPWFVAAVAAGPGSAERERFIFRRGRGERGELPPNNWPSVFGGPAWTRLPLETPDGRADGEWYLHLFAPEQPDLDWTCPDVPAEFDRILRFWLDRGVDGFRIDVAHAMAKPAGLPDLDGRTLAALDTSTPTPGADDVRWDADAVHDIHRRFRRVLDEYDGERMAVGEAWVHSPKRLARYVRADELNLAFNFELLEAPWGAASYRRAIDRSMTALADVGAPCTWVLANHDMPRAATRFAKGTTPAVGLARARAAALVQFALPGTAYVYNGDELGLPNVDLPDWALQDPTWERSGHTERGRDGERVPMPWSGEDPPYGFSTAAQTWLPMPSTWADLTVAAQEADPNSTLALYRRAIELRTSRAAFASGAFEWIDAPADCLAFRRGKIVVMLNAGDAGVPMPAGDVLLASGPVGAELPGATAVWLAGR
ncbi:MAG TPA: glycoside hydrolase family 13 protein [Jatrophihabitantaceae bacterium]|nr:glycoside hydrolase family 13 protein [Jatrophihabitantaceae bacterium]